MKNGALRKVGELPPDTRHAMESIIGRSLGEDEAISINVYKPAPTGEAREAPPDNFSSVSTRLQTRYKVCRKGKLTLRLTKRQIMYDIILNDDPVVCTAVVGRADVLCALDRDFYAANVISLCNERGIAIMNDAELLRELRPDQR